VPEWTFAADARGISCFRRYFLLYYEFRGSGKAIAMTSVGETLRRERLRHNLDLDAVSRELKISARMLEAIEAEKFEKLPGSVFAKSFVRQYARMLGLDEEELAGEVQRALGPPPSELPRFAEAAKPQVEHFAVPRLQQWEAVSDEPRFSWSSPLPALALFVAVIMGCSGIYAWWQHTRHPAAAQSAAVPAQRPQTPPLPAAQPPAVQPVSAPAQAPVETAAQPPSQTDSASRQSTAGTLGAPGAANSTAARVEPAAAIAAQPAAAQPGAPAPQASLPSNPHAAVKVELTASEPVWVLARSDGKYLFSGTLDANQSRTVEANSSVLLRLGNAGGVTILLNGKPIGAVGPKGQVRTVELTPGGFQVTAPKITPPSDPLINRP